MILAGCTIGVTSCKTETKNSETKGIVLQLSLPIRIRRLQLHTLLRLKVNRILIFIRKFRDTLKS